MSHNIFEIEFSIPFGSYFQIIKCIFFLAMSKIIESLHKQWYTYADKFTNLVKKGKC